uniref:EZH inhibitory protein n=1 Tax=Sus scrofa TaxID=9823 RepID=A0A8D1C9H8_PIG
MATQSRWEKEQQPQQGEMPTELKNGVISVPGNACEIENLDPGAMVSTVFRDLSPSGGGAPHGDTVSSSSCDVADAGAISGAREDPGPPAVEGVQERGCSNLQGGGSSLVKLRCVVPATGQGVQIAPSGSGATIGQAAGGSGRRPTQTAIPGKGRRKKRPRGEEAAPAQKPRRRSLFRGAAGPQWPLLLPPSSLRSNPSSCSGHSEASQWSNASPPGPALRSQAKAPGPALRGQAARPGPATRGRTTLPGPVLRSHTSKSDDALATCASEPRSSRCHRRRHASVPDPALRGHTTPLAPALLSQAARSGPVLRSQAKAPDPALRGQAARPGSAQQGRTTQPGPVLLDQARGQAARPGPALCSHTFGSCAPLHSHASEPGSSLHSLGAPVPGLVLCHPAAQPGCVPCSSASCPGPALHHGVIMSGPTLQSCATQPGPAVHSHASTPGPVLRSHTAQQRSAPCSPSSASGPVAQSPPSSSGLALRSLVFQSSSSSPDPEVFRFAAQPDSAIQMSSSSSSSLGVFYTLFPGPGSMSCSSSPGSPSLSPCSSRSGCSVQSSSPSSHRFWSLGSGSTSTTSPASIRCALMWDLDGLSPVSSGSLSSSPTPSVP